MIFESYVTPDFADRVRLMAGRLGMNADNIMACIAFESNFSPTAKNPRSTATGLIQFMSATAIGLGTTTALLAQMTPVVQLDWVEKYFQQQTDKYGRLVTLINTYLAIFYPAAIPLADSFVFPASVVKANPIFDVNKDGIMTKGELAQYFTDWVKKKLIQKK